MTEFVITLPVFIVLFAGIVKFGKIVQETSRSHGRANLDTFRQLLRIQKTDQDTLESRFSGDLNIGDTAHLHPSAASVDAGKQLIEHPPRASNELAKGTLTTLESGYNSAMASYGHFGEMAAWAGPVAELKDLPMIGNAVSPTPHRLFGPVRRRPILAPSLVKDSVVSKVKTSGRCKSFLGNLMTKANEALTASGSRPMIAAGIRYGTVTGTYHDPNVAGMGIEAETYYNARVAPHVFPEIPELQTTMATIITRLGMQSCARIPYQQALGISGGANTPLDGGRLPKQWQKFVVEVPVPYDPGETGGSGRSIGFGEPLDYGGDPPHPPGYH
jgi:hypothetical protein